MNSATPPVAVYDLISKIDQLRDPLTMSGTAKFIGEKTLDANAENLKLTMSDVDRFKKQVDELFEQVTDGS